MIHWDTAPEFMAGAELCAAYQRTEGETDDPRAEGLLAEIEKRDLDF